LHLDLLDEPEQNPHLAFPPFNSSSARRSPVVLTGYAYETIPGKPILEGHTFGPEEADSFAPTELQVPAPRPASLGVLALGAQGLTAGRREEDMVAQ
jgi:hypothetical protein